MTKEEICTLMESVNKTNDEFFNDINCPLDSNENIGNFIKKITDIAKELNGYRLGIKYCYKNISSRIEKDRLNKIDITIQDLCYYIYETCEYFAKLYEKSFTIITKDTQEKIYSTLNEHLKFIYLFGIEEHMKSIILGFINYKY